MSKIIIGALVGAVIGYITNYIAIKMLFRPHTEKRIFGIKVPFTPGLIPKEKDRIAKSIGENIGEHLLNGSTIKKTLKEEKTKKHIDKEIKKQVTNILNSDKSIKQICNEVIKIDFNKFKNGLSEKILNSVYEEVFKESFKENIHSQFKNYALDNLHRKPTYIIGCLNNPIIKERICNILDQFVGMQRENINSSLLDKISSLENSNEKIKQYIPNNVQGLIENFICDEKNIICEKIYGLFLNEDVSREIKDTITNNVLGKLSPLVSMFLNVDVLYDKFLESAKIYFENESNQEVIVRVINEELKELSNKEVGVILSRISNSVKEDIIYKSSDRLVSKMKENLNSEVVLNLLKEQVNSYNSYAKILKDLGIDYNEIIEKFTDKIYREIKLNEKVKDNLKSITLKFIENIGKETLSKLIKGNENKVIDTISLSIQTKYDDFVENKIEKLLKFLDIPKIVEKEIKNFEVDYAEKIILDIANKELKAITWLGALLGGILGIITPIISKLY